MNPYSIARSWWRLLIPKRELVEAKSGDRIRIPGVSIDIVWDHLFGDDSNIILWSQEGI